MPAGCQLSKKADRFGFAPPPGIKTRKFVGKGGKTRALCQEFWNPGSNASGSFAFGSLWQVGRLVIENNSIELVLTITTGIDVPTGIRLDRAASNPPLVVALPYTIAQAILRGNVIRHVNNASDSTGFPLAIQLNSCEAAIVEDNVINLDINKPIQFTACGSVKFFNNESPAGSLIQGYDSAKIQFVNELTTDADLSVILAT
jgi:hypothetical protein